MDLQLYSYFRSSASWRVRIALALKNLPHAYHGVHLVKGEQKGHASLGAAHLLPALWVDGQRLTQSLAILEFLEEAQPQPPLLPSDPHARAYARSLALDIACEIHPLNNLRVLGHLKTVLGVEEAARTEWMRHWMVEGLAVVDARLKAEGRMGRYCLGDTPGYADCVLVPQVFNARRFGAPIDHLDAVLAINEACLALPAFADTHPSRVPDAE
ncbi:maleylacetoacetate isomerase/maleylpyruvate isomerase [Inhella inkyongensis]|uniref:Maleylacetoacetate isomerase/maleylpyruvate isomerase n=1 Tax=Inhella inkyongensis TaxID=392593 RepID=A0A840S3P1_9BURK|nr:maleylacetoacetate isomerase [Inhella inkyongensis]MBB5203666.1 maleylacetoacetate isomerase/maleylpyruvate isomerase [Inhella inkyongensis]